LLLPLCALGSYLPQGEPYGHNNGAASNYGWPHVGSSFGSFDLAGFPKAAVWWYRALWLSGIGEKSPDRPPLPQSHTIRIVQDNEKASRARAPGLQRSLSDGQDLINIIQVYSSCPTVELLVNGVSQGNRTVQRYMWAEFNFSYVAGNLTAVGYSASGAVVATHTVETTSAAVGLRVSVDVPSAITGTGEALMLDGQDVGLLRAEVIDAEGRLVPSACNNITFRVVSGPGRIVGVGNGDPTNHQPNRAAWRAAFHGLVRGVVQVTADAASPDRDLLLEVDMDRGPWLEIVPSTMPAPTLPIIVEVSSPGLGSSRTSINVSSNIAHDGVLAVASRSTHIAYVYQP
jgi:hypothetical protein